MRRLLIVGVAATMLATTVVSGGSAHAGAARGAATPVGTAPSRSTPAQPGPSASSRAALAKAHPFQPVAAGTSQAKRQPSRPDFGPHERVLKAYHAGKLSRDDAVRYGLAALRSPASVPANLRPTGAISDVEGYLTYLSALSMTATPAASTTLTASVAPAATPADTTGYDDCAAPDYDYFNLTFDCRADAGDFLILYNVASNGRPGIPPVYNANGRPEAVQYMLNALNVAAGEYRKMGYRLPVRDGNRPYVFVYGMDNVYGFPITAPFTLPAGLNQQPMTLLPSTERYWDYTPRHELFHFVQYQYWTKSDMAWDLVDLQSPSDTFGSINWWMEATAEWAAHQTYVRVPLDPLNQSGLYARNVTEVLSHPEQPLNKWGGLGGGPQYGEFLFAQFATERTDPDFVRHTWEYIGDHDQLPIDAIASTMQGYGLSLPDVLLDYHVANYRLAPSYTGPAPEGWTAYGYADADTKVWRKDLESGADTGDDGLGGARPARTQHFVSSGSHFELHDTVYKGGATYHDFWAESGSGDPDCGYCSTLLIDTTKNANRGSVLLIWSAADYPTVTTMKYPDAGGLISVSDFRYPMVATLVSVRTELNASSAHTADEAATFDTYVETTAPLRERSCSLKAPVVQSVELHVSPEAQFNAYAARTPNGWTGADSTYSVQLPDGRDVWLFSDTFLGPLNSDGTRPANAPMVNNTFVTTNGTMMTSYQGGTPDAPKAIMPPQSANRWFWIGDGHMSGGYLQVVFQEYEKFGPGSWDFRFHRNVVADFDPLNLSTPVRVRDLPSDSGVAWGSALLPASRSGDGYTYIYGVDDSPINKQMRIARVHGDDLAGGTWQYYTPWGWTFREQNARNTVTGIANEYSVTPWNGQFLMVSQDSTEAFSGRIMAYTSCSPFGPFTNRNEVYRMPEPGPYGSYGNGNIIAYNAHVHAELSSGNSFVVSYNVNSMDTTIGAGGDLYRDPGIYRPRFFRFTLQ